MARANVKRAQKARRGRAPASAGVLLDREGFDHAAREAFGREPAGSVFLIDLDGFHQINVSAGHAAGDRVIAATGKTLAETAKREGWLCGRIGGDEFALLAPGLALEAAFLRADRLRLILDEALASAVPAGLRCTASIGVANAPRDAKTADDLPRKAELALPAAKEQGGDTVGLTPGNDTVLKSSYYRTA
jgi:diguanylate cyclase (GGDEF)-like protein